MRKLLLSLVLAAVMMLAFAGCQPETAPEPAEPVEVRVGYLSGPIALSMIQMVNDQPSLGENVTANYEMMTSPSVVTGEMTAGTVDFAILATNQAAMLYNKGVEYQVAASSIWGALYLMGTGELESVADLAGKEIALIGQGLTPDIVTRQTLLDNGLNPDEDVTLTYLATPQELLQSVIMGKYQYAVLPQPLASVSQIKKPEVQVLLDFQEEWAKVTGASSYPQSSLLVRKAFAEAHPEVVESMMAAYEASIGWATANVEELGAAAEAMEIGMTAGVVKKSFEACNIRYVSVDDARADLQDYLQKIYELMPESVGNAVPDDGFYFSGE